MHKSKLSTCIAAASVAAVASAFSVSSSAQLPTDTIFQHFDDSLAADPGSTLDDTAVDDLGWNIYGAAFDGSSTPDASGNSTFPGAFLYQYGWWEVCCGLTPNGGDAFSAIVDDTTNKFLNIYNDYANAGHTDATVPYEVINSLVLQEHILAAGDLSKVATFRFDARRPSADASGNDFAVGIGCTTFCEASAFLKTLDGGTEILLAEEDMTATPQGAWTTYTMSIDLGTLDASGNAVSAVGHKLQFGFGSMASQGDNTGVYYDNVCFTTESDIDAACQGQAEVIPSNVPVPAFAVAIFAGLCAGIGALVRRRVS